MVQVEIVVNGESARLPYDQIDNIIYSIPDDGHNNVMAELIKSPNPRVRMAVASRRSLNRKIVEALVEDTQIEVLRYLVSNGKARRYIPESCLLRLIRTEDHEIQETVANDLDSFRLCDKETLVEKLVRSDDPVIRGILAGEKSVGRQVLEFLAADDDEDVADLAKETLEELNTEEGIDEDEYEDADDDDDDDD